MAEAAAPQITAFSAEGQLLQVEYATESVRRSAPCVGIRAADAVVLAVERRSAAKLQDARSSSRIMRLDKAMAITSAGLHADARVMYDKARIECESFTLTVDRAPSVEYMARYVGATQQKYTQRGGVRPFGLALLLAGVDADGSPQLWATEPSGAYSAWKAHAVGRGSRALEALLEREYDDGMDEAAAVRLACRCLLEASAAAGALLLPPAAGGAGAGTGGGANIEVGIVRLGAGAEMLADADVAAVVASLLAERAYALAASSAASSAAASTAGGSTLSPSPDGSGGGGGRSASASTAFSAGACISGPPSPPMSHTPPPHALTRERESPESTGV